MKTYLLAAALLFAGLAGLVLSTGSVSAVGPPSDNLSYPESPLKDTHPEIKPPIEAIPDTISRLPKSPPPAISLEFSGPTEGSLKVTGAETWLLFIDINTPGWVYIYEKLPPGSDPPGRWLAYKWRILQEGRWRLGPLSAAADEPAGQHIYQAWFFGDDQWAPQPAPNTSVVWTYDKAATSIPPKLPPQPVKEETTPVKPETPPAGTDTVRDQFLGFITNPIVLVFGPTVLLLIIFFAILLLRAYKKRALAAAAAGNSTTAAGETSLLSGIPETASYREAVAPLWGETRNGAPSETMETAEPAVEEPLLTHARLSLPNGSEIILSGGREIGRAELVRAAGLDELGLISRKHFSISCDGEHYFIEDSGSANGTHLNGEDIAGKGPVALKDKDSIELPGALRIRFHLV